MAELEVVDRVREGEYACFDLRMEACAAAIGSPQVVSVNDGNPPSTGKKTPGGELGTRDMLAGLRGANDESDEEREVIVAPGPPVDRWSLNVGEEPPADSECSLPLWRPFCSLDFVSCAASASGPVDPSLPGGDEVVVVVVVVQALAVPRAFDTVWDCPGAGHCELVDTSPLAGVVAVRGWGAPRGFHAGWRCPGMGDCVVGGSPLPLGDAAAGSTLAEPRASTGLTNPGGSDGNVWLVLTVTLPLADGMDEALALGAAERAA